MTTAKVPNILEGSLKIGDVVLTKNKQVCVVKYIGKIPEKKSNKIWYGLLIRMTEGPLGDCDGKVGNKIYFTCQPDGGLFVLLYMIERKITPNELLDKVISLTNKNSKLLKRVKSKNKKSNKKKKDNKKRKQPPLTQSQSYGDDSPSPQQESISSFNSPRNEINRLSLSHTDSFLNGFQTSELMFKNNENIDESNDNVLINYDKPRRVSGTLTLKLNNSVTSHTPDVNINTKSNYSFNVDEMNKQNNNNNNRNNSNNSNNSNNNSSVDGSIKNSKISGASIIGVDGIQTANSMKIDVNSGVSYVNTNQSNGHFEPLTPNSQRVRKKEIIKWDDTRVLSWLKDSLENDDIKYDYNNVYNIFSRNKINGQDLLELNTIEMNKIGIIDANLRTKISYNINKLFSKTNNNNNDKKIIHQFDVNDALIEDQTKVPKQKTVQDIIQSPKKSPKKHVSYNNVKPFQVQPFNELEQYFSWLDINKDNQLNYVEFTSVLEDLSMHFEHEISDKIIKKCFKEFDLTNSGFITLPEFIAVMGKIYLKNISKNKGKKMSQSDIQKQFIKIINILVKKYTKKRRHSPSSSTKQHYKNISISGSISRSRSKPPPPKQKRSLSRKNTKPPPPPRKNTANDDVIIQEIQEIHL